MKHFTDHAADRVKERYGLEPTDAEWSCAVLDIIDVTTGHGSAALLLRRFNDGSELWIARLAGRCMKLIYQPRAALIVTVLPEDARAAGT